VLIASELYIDRGVTTLRSEDDGDEEIRKGVCHAEDHRSVAAPRLFCLLSMEPRASRHRAADLAPLRGCFVSEVREPGLKNVSGIPTPKESQRVAGVSPKATTGLRIPIDLTPKASQPFEQITKYQTCHMTQRRGCMICDASGIDVLRRLVSGGRFQRRTGYRLGRLRRPGEASTIEGEAARSLAALRAPHATAR
jgi:hypothetical protein